MTDEDVGEFAAHQQGGDVFVDGGPVDDHAVRQLLQDDLLGGAAGHLFATGVHDGQSIALFAQGALHPAENVEHVGVCIGDVGGQTGQVDDVPGGPPCQAGCPAVGGILQLPHHLLYPAGGLLRDTGVMVEDFGDGGHRNACPGGHVLDGDGHRVLPFPVFGKSIV